MCKIYHPVRGLIIQTKMTVNRIFVLMARAQVKETSYFHAHAHAQNLSHLQHYKYGHLSHKGQEPCNTRKWFEDYHNFLHQLQCALPVSLVSSIAIPSQKKASGEHLRGYNSFMLTFVAQSHQSQIARKGIRYVLLMTIVKKHGFILQQKNQKLSSFSSILKSLLKRKLDNLLSV